MIVKVYFLPGIIIVGDMWRNGYGRKEMDSTGQVQILAEVVWVSFSR